MTGRSYVQSGTITQPRMVIDSDGKVTIWLNDDGTSFLVLDDPETAGPLLDAAQAAYDELMTRRSLSPRFTPAINPPGPTRPNGDPESVRQADPAQAAGPGADDGESELLAGDQEAADAWEPEPGSQLAAMAAYAANRAEEQRAAEAAAAQDDPGGPVCGERDGDWTCGSPSGHPPPHVGAYHPGGLTAVHTWPQEVTT